jgi:competence protein ComEA
MFTGLTRQEQRTLLLLLGIIVAGIAIHQWRDTHRPSALIIDGESGRIVHIPEALRDAPAAELGTASAPESTPSEPSPTGSAILVDLNTATLTDLTTVPGIGETRARAIVAHRDQHGSFTRIEDLMNVSGIGEGLFSRARDHITVTGVAAAPSVTQARGLTAQAEPAPSSDGTAVFSQQPTPSGAVPTLVNVNTAGMEELMTLPRIGEVMARRIIEHRAVNGPFRHPEDLLAIPRIGPATLEQMRPLITF